MNDQKSLIPFTGFNKDTFVELNVLLCKICSSDEEKQKYVKKFANDLEDLMLKHKVVRVNANLFKRL